MASWKRLLPTICKQFTVCWLYQNNLSVNFTQEYHFPLQSCVCVTRVCVWGGLKKGKIQEQRPHLDFIFKLSSDTNTWHFYSFNIKFKYTSSVGVNHTQSFSFSPNLSILIRILQGNQLNKTPQQPSPGLYFSLSWKRAFCSVQNILFMPNSIMLSTIKIMRVAYKRQNLLLWVATWKTLNNCESVCVYRTKPYQRENTIMQQDGRQRSKFVRLFTFSSLSLSLF